MGEIDAAGGGIDGDVVEVFARAALGGAKTVFFEQVVSDAGWMSESETTESEQGDGETKEDPERNFSRSRELPKLDARFSSEISKKRKICDRHFHSLESASYLWTQSFGTILSVRRRWNTYWRTTSSTECPISGRHSGRRTLILPTMTSACRTPRRVIVFALDGVDGTALVKAKDLVAQVQSVAEDAKSLVETVAALNVKLRVSVEIDVTTRAF